MAVYDKNINIDTEFNEALAKNNESIVYFSDGQFYPYLKYFINQSTKIPNTHIFIRDYGENNPFLEQSQAPKVYCEMYDFKTPCITGNFDANGDMYLYASVRYRIYFVNDNYRAPFLFESAMKGNVDKFENVAKDFIKAYDEHKFKFCVPKTMTLSSSKEHKGLSTYPIIIYDILMTGYITQNIKELENIPFDEAHLVVNLKQRS